MNAGSYFDPRDKSSRAMFYRSHDAYMRRLHAFVEMMNGPNPLTETDLKKLKEKFPGRYDHLNFPKTPHKEST